MIWNIFIFSLFIPKFQSKSVKQQANWDSDFLPLYNDEHLFGKGIRPRLIQQINLSPDNVGYDDSTVTITTSLPLTQTTSGYYIDSDSCFSTYWNVPSEPSCSTQLGTKLPLDEFGIKANSEQKFYGTVINIFYDKTGAWPYLKMRENWQNLSTTSYTTTVGIIDTWEQYLIKRRRKRQLRDDQVEEVNGGIPQKGDLQNHLNIFAQSVERLMPNPEYDGVAVIDFEQFTLDLNMIQGKFSNTYKKKSLEYAKEIYPNVTDDQQLSDLSTWLFNNASRQFFEQTLQLGIEMRPQAKWGYYGFPYCFRIDLDTLNCSTRNQNFNDGIMWLYELSTAVFPTIYLHKKALPSDINRGVWVHKVLSEVQRIKTNLQTKSSLPAYPYFRYEYPADYTNQTENFLTRTDVVFCFKQALDMGIDGMIIWASSNNMAQRCSNLSSYIQETLGPIILQTNQFYQQCKIELCSGIMQNEVSKSTSTQGRCKGKFINSMDYIYQLYKEAQNDSLYPSDNETIHLNYYCTY